MSKYFTREDLTNFANRVYLYLDSDIVSAIDDIPDEVIDKVFTRFTGEYGVPPEEYLEVCNTSLFECFPDAMASSMYASLAESVTRDFARLVRSEHLAFLGLDANDR